MVNRSDGSTIVDANGNEVTAELPFTATSSNDTKRLSFTLDSRKLEGVETVVYEDLYRGVELVAEEKNLSETQQSIVFVNVTIGTTATDANTGTQQSTIGNATIYDDIKISSVDPGTTYTIKGKLINRATGEVVIDADGKAVTNEMQFTPSSIDDDVARMTFTLNSSNLEGIETVVYEELYIGDTLLDDEKNINETSQMIFFPKAKTKAADFVTGNGVGSELSTRIVDRVSCSNLIVGKTYTISGTLMDAATGNPIFKADGDPITASTTFTAEEKNPTINVVFDFPAGVLKGKTTVVFEDVYHEGIKICTHSDLSDKDQTVSYGKIGTDAVDTDTLTQVGVCHENARITDIVKYKNLPEGTYTIKGVLMDKATSQPLKDKNGNNITASKTLTVTTGNESGEIKVDFSLDTRGMEGKSIVVF